MAMIFAAAFFSWWLMDEALMCCARIPRTWGETYPLYPALLVNSWVLV